jgi:hypothetical protein
MLKTKAEGIMRQIGKRWPVNLVSESGILQISVDNQTYQRISRIVGRK